MKKINGWKRLAAAAVTLALCLTLLPLPEGESARAAGSYGKATANGVRVRKQPSTTADYWFRIDMGYVCELMDVTTAEGLTWYKVTVENPKPDSTRTYVGYIHGDFFVPLTEEEAAAWEANPVQPDSTGTTSTTGTTGTTGTTTGTNDTTGTTTGATGTTGTTGTTAAASGATGQITNGGVNFRESEGGAVIQKLDRGTVVELLSIPTVIDSNHWYQVRYDGKTGYVQAPFIRVLTTGQAPTAPSTGGSSVTTPQTTSYVKLILSSANLRVSPGGKVGAQWETTGEIIAVTGTPVQQGGYTWYPVTYAGGAYYVRGDCVQVVASADGSATATPTPTPTPTPTLATQTGSYVKLILSSANLRVSPGGKVGAQWETTGEIIPVTGTPVQQGGYTWYPVAYAGGAYYVRGDCVQVVSSADGSVTPSPTPTPAAGLGYVKTIKNNVNLRLKPAGDYIQQVPINTVLAMQAAVVIQDGYGWYYVNVNGVKGYLRGDCVQVCDANGNALATTPPAATDTPAPGTSTYGYVLLTQDKVNLRTKPAGSSMEQLPKGQILPMTGPAVKSGAYTWYPVRATSGQVGYVRGDCAVMTDASGAATTPPEATATNTASATAYGYAMVTMPSTNLRKTPGGTKVGSVEKNTVWPMTGNATSSGGYTWYPINVNGVTGYVRGDCAFKLSATQEASYLAGNGVPDESTTTPSTTVTYVITTLDKVNLRASASKDAAAPYNVALGTVMAYNTTKTVGGSLWYQVIYDNTEVWVLGSCVKAMTDAEYQAWLATQPAVTPQPEVIVGYVRTTASGVNLRTTANGANIIGRIDKGVVMSYSQEPVVVRNYTWYYVKSPTLGYGYVRGDCVETCQQDGSALPTAVPTATPDGGLPEATYTTLRKGSTGTAVKALVAELKAQGYYTGTITSTYTSAVETAVKAFQRDKGLTVDGIAGKLTQHALFGTVEPGTSDTSNLTMAIYPAEKIDWYTGGIQQLWPKGANFKVYDVKTGIVWWAHRWSGGSHVDAEPLTAADTARLCKIYGVSSADQIASKNLWQRRPMLVTIGTRTFACSLYGIPHNYPDGDTISTNNFKGQLCIHFTNSKTHTSNKVDTYHTEAIQYAWEHAPNGHI